LTKTGLRRIEQLTCLILMLTSVFVSLLLLPKAVAVTSILGVSPSSGNVGTLVVISANLTTANGKYEVYFDTNLTASGTASVNSVNATFIVPQAKAGGHNVIVTDVATGENATETFNVTTSYSLDIPAMVEPLQENDTVPISINITGGTGETYVANITVQAPTNVSYVKMLSVKTSVFGNGTATASYPGDFSGGANSSFVGQYAVFFNTTLGQKAFSVELTNSTQYHRGQTVNVKAVYEPNENVTLTITGKNVNESVNLTEASGLIRYDWTVPMNASIGNYTVSVVSLSGFTVKVPADTQNFTVPGFAVNVTTRNLAGEFVPSVVVTAFEDGNVADNETTAAANGSATLDLEVGNFTCEAYTGTENVGELSIQVNATASLDFFCNLTNLRVQVVSLVNGVEVGVPDAGVYLGPNDETFSTDLNGTVVVHSLLPVVPSLTYFLNVTRYSICFNVTTIPDLLVNETGVETAVAWFNVTVTCPTLTLQVNATRSDGQPISNAVVRVQEMLGVPLYEGYTDASGGATFNPPLGRYSVTVYDNSTGLMLNETTVDLFQNQSASVQCDLYGLAVTVKVVDYFGQGIGNVNVKLQREGEPTMSEVTQGDGTVTFDNVIGGSVELGFYLGGSAEPVVAEGVTVQRSMTIQVKMDQYLVLAGWLVETSQFATMIVIVLAVVLILVVEVFWIRRSRAKKGEKESSDKEP
jgi:hypothetical protein